MSYFVAAPYKKLKNRFKESSIRIDFNFNLKASNPLKEDLEAIPKEKHSSREYELIGRIDNLFYKDWGHNIIFAVSSKQYNKSKYAFSKKNIIVLECILDVNTYNHIGTQNKKLSKLLFKIIVAEN